MRTRFASTVFGLMNSAAATSRLVEPAAARPATRASVALSRPRRYPLQLGLRPLRPQSCPELLEQRCRPLERRLRLPLVLQAPLDLPLDEQRASELERHRQPLVLGERLLDRRGSSAEFALSGLEERPAPPGGGAVPGDLARGGMLLETDKLFFCLVELAGRDCGFDGVRVHAAHCRFPEPGVVEDRERPAELLRGAGCLAS
jgi:hypothetical protein